MEFSDEGEQRDEDIFLGLYTPLPKNPSPHHPSKKERLKNLANTRSCGEDALLGGAESASRPVILNCFSCATVHLNQLQGLGAGERAYLLRNAVPSRVSRGDFHPARRKFVPVL